MPSVFSHVECPAGGVRNSFAFVGCKIRPRRHRIDAKKSFHGRVAPGKFLRMPLVGFENFSLAWAHSLEVSPGLLEEKRILVVIVARDAPQGASGSASSGASRSAQENRETPVVAGNLLDRERLRPLTQAAKTQIRARRYFAGVETTPCFNNVEAMAARDLIARARRIKNGALQNAHVRFHVEAKLLRVALWFDEPEGFPRVTHAEEVNPTRLSDFLYCVSTRIAANRANPMALIIPFFLPSPRSFHKLPGIILCFRARNPRGGRVAKQNFEAPGVMKLNVSLSPHILVRAHAIPFCHGLYGGRGSNEYSCRKVPAEETAGQVTTRPWCSYRRRVSM